MALFGGIIAVCKQYGPSRLPYAQRRDVAAGYAMATVAALMTTAFILITQLVGISTIMSSWYAGYDGPLLEQLSEWPRQSLEDASLGSSSGESRNFVCAVAFQPGSRR